MAADDPLLAAIAQARAARDSADGALRVLVAYAREVVGPRPYTLADVARVSGWSISGVRTAYGSADVASARSLMQQPSDRARSD